LSALTPPKDEMSTLEALMPSAARAAVRDAGVQSDAGMRPIHGEWDVLCLFVVDFLDDVLRDF